VTRRYSEDTFQHSVDRWQVGGLHSDLNAIRYVDEALMTVTIASAFTQGYRSWTVFQAPGEAEVELAYLNQIEEIDAVLLDNMDNFLFRARTASHSSTDHMYHVEIDPTRITIISRTFARGIYTLGTTLALPSAHAACQAA